MKSARTAGRPTVLFAANSSWNLVNFRRPIIEGLQQRSYRVAAAVPDDEAAPALRAMGVDVHFVPVDARGLSPLRDARLLLGYRKLLGKLKPEAVLCFTVKPNIYASAAAAWLGIPVVNTITGLGTGFLSGRALQALVSRLYRWALRPSAQVFFHNADDRALFVDRKLVTAEQARIVAGSGIDLKQFSPALAEASDRPQIFLFIGRFLRDKGAVEFAQAAALVKNDRDARFRMLGSIEDHPKAAPREIFERLERDGAIELLGTADDVRPFIAEADCVVLPSYREGLPRVILEASAMARPSISTDVPGCRDAVDHWVTGLLCEPRSAAALAQAMSAFADLSADDRVAMGKRARLKAERQFSHERVVNAYLDALRELGI